MKLYKIILFSALILAFLPFAFFSCSKKPLSPQTKTAQDPDTTRKKAKKKDPKKQAKCIEMGSGECEEECKKTCDDIFSGDAEDDCQKLSKSLVEEFEKIIDDTEDGDTDDLHKYTSALSCLLDLDDQEFVSAVKKMSSREAREFLKNIAEKDDLAEVFYEEDDEFNILKQSLKEIANSNDLNNILKASIDDGKPFFWLSAEEKNESAFDWIDDYVGELCEDSSSDCPGYNEVDELGAYCKILVTYTDAKLKDFLSSAKSFNDKYEGSVESADYEYTLSSGTKDFVDYIWNEELKGDFKDFCRLEVAIKTGERKLRTRATQEKYFNTDFCKENMKPAGGDTDNDGTANDADDIARIWALKNCASDSPYTCLTDSNHADYFTGYNENEYVWEWGNIYGESADRAATPPTFNANRFKGIGQSFWFLDDEKKIIVPRIHSEFEIFMKRGYVKATPEETEAGFKDPKVEKVRRASFMYYIPSQNDTTYPDCNRDTGDEDKCLYSYCLVDYELNQDNTVKTCDVLKCALGRPTSITP